MGVCVAAVVVFGVVGSLLESYLGTVFAVVCVLMLAALVWLEFVKARRIAKEAVAASGIEQLAGESHAETVRRVTESRRVIVDAFELERARIERDLHDGAQQYVVAAAMKVGEASLGLEGVRDPAARAVADLLAAAQDDTDAALAALRETVAGVHSRLLAEQGLEAALRDLVARLSGQGREVILRVPHPLPPLPAGVASTAWFFAAEALTNAAKHAPGASASVTVAADRDLRISVVDAGPGGASITPGRGLAGMRERLRAFGGELSVASPAGGPTTVSARVPLLLRAGEPAHADDPLGDGPVSEGPVGDGPVADVPVADGPVSDGRQEEVA